MSTARRRHYRFETVGLVTAPLANRREAAAAVAAAAVHPSYPATGSVPTQFLYHTRRVRFHVGLFVRSTVRPPSVRLVTIFFFFLVI